MKECQYKKKCKSWGIMCDSCKHNPNPDEDYYEPNNKRPRIWTTDPNTNPFYKVTIADGSQLSKMYSKVLK